MPYQLRIGPNVTQSTTAIINDATETNDGVMTKAMVKQLNDNSKKDSDCCAVGDVFIYLSPTGNDSKDGSTPAKAVKTIGRAMQLKPNTWRADPNVAGDRGRMRFIFAPGTYAWPVEKTNYAHGSPLNENAQPLIFVGAFTNEIGTKSVTVGSNGESATGVLGLAVDVYYGFWISMTSGANSGQRRMITGNTANTISVNSPFDNPVSIGDKFIVEKTAVTITIPSSTNMGLSGFSTSPVGYKGIKFVPDNTFVSVAHNGPSTCEACEFDLSLGGTLLIEYNGTLFAEGDQAGYGNADPQAVFSPGLRFQAGCYIHDGTILVQNSMANLEGYIVTKNVYLQLNNGQLNLFQPFCRDTFIESFGASLTQAFGGAFNGFVTVRAVFDGAGSGIDFDDSSDFALFTTDFNGTQFINVHARSFGKLFDIGGVTVSPVGLRVVECSQAQVDAATTITGTVGDVRVGTLAIIPGAGAGYAAIIAGPGITDTTALCRIEPI